MIDHEALASGEGLESDTGALADGAKEPPLRAGSGGSNCAAWVVTAIDLTNGPMLVQLGFQTVRVTHRCSCLWSIPS